MKKIIGLLSFTILFNCCSVPVVFYLRNTTDTTKVIQVHLKNKNLQTYSLFYENKIFDPLKFKTFDDLNRKLSPFRKEDRKLFYRLPPKSTFLIGRGINFKNFTFEQITIFDEDESSIELSLNDPNIFKSAKSPISRFYLWYDIE